MTEQEIKDLFFETLSERGISNKIGVGRSVVSHWKGDRPPTFALMLEVLFKLDKIKITANG